MLAAISRVAAPCSATDWPITSAMSVNWSMVAPIRPIATTVSRVIACIRSTWA